MIRVSRKAFRREVIVDDDADTSYLEQDAFTDRLAALHNGDFGYCGVRATVELAIPLGKDHGVLQAISSPGIWGIEDDSGDEYLNEVYAEECDTLATMLKALGVKVMK